MIEVLYEDNHVLCVKKPINIPVMADDSHDVDLLTMCKEYLKEKYQKPGNVYCGLVHRLDRPVGGVMVFAKTSKAASRLSEAVRTHALQKEYIAILDGHPKKDSDTLEDYLVKDTRTNTVTVTDAKHGKKCRLHYDTVVKNKDHTLVHIHLETGRSHQIRVQFASRNTPLVHDQRYNTHTNKGPIGLFAFRLTFPHPTLKTPIVIQATPDGNPWKEFEVNYDKL